jgi:HSP20 family molecular chaperone IbpA
MTRFHINNAQREAANNFTTGNTTRYTLVNTQQSASLKSDAVPHFATVDRWSTDAPIIRPLDYKLIDTRKDQLALIQLPERGMGVVDLELSGNRLFVLVTTQDHLQQKIREYFCQIDLPGTVTAACADAELTDFVLTVTFRTNQTVTIRLNRHELVARGLNLIIKTTS